MRCGDPIWHDEIDVADVDAQLERGRGHERLQLSGLQPRFRIEPLLLRQAAVVGRDRVLAEAIAQVPREPFGHPPRVDEDQCCPMLRDQLGEPIVISPPTPRATSPLRAATAAPRAPRSISRRCPSSTIAAVGHAGRVDRRSSRPETARLLRSASASRRGRSAAAAGRHLLQPLQAEREVRPASRADDRVDFVDDDGADGAQHLAAALGRQQQIQRLGRRHQDVRRRAQHRRALGLRRVAGSDGGGDARRNEPSSSATRRRPRRGSDRFL